MVENSDNRDLEKEEAERKRLHDEMMASLIKTADKWKESKEQAKQRELEVTEVTEKDKKTLFLVIGVILIAILISITLPSKPDETTALDDQTISSCMGDNRNGINEARYKEKCNKKFVKITAFIVGREYGKTQLNLNLPSPLDSQYSLKSPNDFAAIGTFQSKPGDYEKYGNKYLIKGIFDGDSGVFIKQANIKTSEMIQLDLSENESKNIELVKKVGTAESQIAAAKEEGVKMLEEVDILIRDNVTVRRKALETAAVEHKRINTSGAIMTDGYTMKDGRFIVCTTKVLSSGPATMDCNGEP